MKRWWSQYCSLPWPDTIATFLRAVKVKEGAEEEGAEEAGAEEDGSEDEAEEKCRGGGC